MARNTGKSKLVFVKLVVDTATIDYGFHSKLLDADKPTLGQVVIDTTTVVTNLVIGANSPKPNRANKKTAAGYNGSFIASDKIAAAKALGWHISRSRNMRKGHDSTLSTTRYVTVNGLKYAWQTPVIPATVTITSLGVQAATSADILVFGASFPKPPRAKIVDSSGVSFEMFYDPSSTPGTGWVQTAAGSYTQADLAMKI